MGDCFGTKNVYLFNDILVITTVVDRHMNSSWIKRFSRDTSQHKATFHWLRNLVVFGTPFGFEVNASASRELIFEATVEPTIANSWIQTFRTQRRRKIMKPNQIRTSSTLVAKPLELTRDDSFVLLQANKNVLDNHMFKLSVHLKQAKKKEKKKLSRLHISLKAEADDLQKQIEDKKIQRQQQMKALRRSSSMDLLRHTVQ